MSRLFLLVCFLITTVPASFSQELAKDELKLHKKFLKEHVGWSWIPAGSYFTEESVATVGGVYMFKTEVTNLQWKEFLYFMEQDKGKEAIYDLLPDTALWLNYNGFDLYAKDYFRNSAYNYFPVVNITYEQAEAYCRWLTTVFNNKTDKAYKSVKIRLPTNAEWMYAAKGGNDSQIFPWEGIDVYNRGVPMGNFFQIPQTLIAYGNSNKGEGMLIMGQNGKPYSWLQGHRDAPATAQSYSPNSFGLYCMGGNVAEFVSDKLPNSRGRMTKGGSWADTGYYLQVSVNQIYSQDKSANPFRGFRVVMEMEY